MRAKVYICDICGVRKEESNHWILAADMMNFEQYFHVAFRPWNPEYAANCDLKHLCGIGCANKLLSQTVESWSAVKEEK